MKLYNLNQLADVIGLSYKALYNRLNHTTGVITVAGRCFQAHKDRGVWLVWSDDVANASEAPTPQPKVSAPKQKPKAKGKHGGFIDFSKLGKG